MEFCAYVQHAHTHTHTHHRCLFVQYILQLRCLLNTSRSVTALLSASCQQLCRISVTVLFDGTVNWKINSFFLVAAVTAVRLKRNGGALQRGNEWRKRLSFCNWFFFFILGVKWNAFVSLKQKMLRRVCFSQEPGYWKIVRETQKVGQFKSSCCSHGYTELFSAWFPRQLKVFKNVSSSRQDMMLAVTFL